MIELIQKLQQATEPSRALDAELWHILPPDNGDRSDPYWAPHFTSSVDAALKLMRKHYLWQLKQGIGCTATVWWLEKDWDDTGAPTTYSTTYPALALATAALIARAVEDRITLPQANQKTRCEECNLLKPCADPECPNSP